VLSYRGMKRHAAGIQWKVSALIGIPVDSPHPVVRVGGVLAAEPEVLAHRARLLILRYDLSVELSEAERRVPYSVSFEDLEESWDFTVPGMDLDVRSAYVSCNGFSDPKEMCKHTGKAGAVWQDLVTNHDRGLHREAPVDKEQYWHLERGIGEEVQRFHVLMMGGDQIYFDSIWDDPELPELKEWASLDRATQLTIGVTEELQTRISDYYFNTYCDRWLNPERRGWTREQARDCADAMARIPTIMMWDDHDIFDGWGSYSQKMQNCPVTQTIFKIAREAFWVYQMQHKLAFLPPLRPASAMVPIDSPQFAPIKWSEVLRDDPLALPLLDDQPGFSSSADLGKVALLVLDLRTERSRKQILGEHTWKAAESTLRDLATWQQGPGRARHFLVMSSVPVAYPKMSIPEKLLGAFGGEHVTKSVADDLQDHWSHDDHEVERKRLTRLLIKTAQERQVRVSIVSGDVHVAAYGNLYRNDFTPDKNWLCIEQLTSSSVLHPVPSGIKEYLYLHYLNSVAEKPQPIDTEHTCEMMGFPEYGKYIMAARNWLALEPDRNPGNAGPRLWATWRCEGDDGFSNHTLVLDPARNA